MLVHGVRGNEVHGRENPLKAMSKESPHKHQELEMSVAEPGTVHFSLLICYCLLSTRGFWTRWKHCPCEYSHFLCSKKCNSKSNTTGDYKLPENNNKKTFPINTYASWPTSCLLNILSMILLLCVELSKVCHLTQWTFNKWTKTGIWKKHSNMQDG